MKAGLHVPFSKAMLLPTMARFAVASNRDYLAYTDCWQVTISLDTSPVSKLQFRTEQFNKKCVPYLYYCRTKPCYTVNALLTPTATAVRLAWPLSSTLSSTLHCFHMSLPLHAGLAHFEAHYVHFGWKLAIEADFNCKVKITLSTKTTTKFTTVECTSVYTMNIW